MPAGMYVCNECERNGKEVRIPADEVGAALMQQHLKDEHHVAFAGTLQSCPECGYAVLTKLGTKLAGCKEHL